MQSKSALIFVVLILISVGQLSDSVGDEPTRKEKSDVRKVRELIDKGGRLFKAKNYDGSHDAIKDAQKRLGKIADVADTELMELLKPEHARLKLAHRLLADVGKELAKLEELPKPRDGGDLKMISFKNEVAPLIVAKCGQCHVRRSRGDFSAASYNALGQSTMIAVGLPNDSRMVEVIVDGDMPPGGSLLESELATLKNWIAQGAKFDADDPAQNLAEMTGNPPPNRRGNIEVAKPTGEETVSFALQVAPVLLDNCAQCHINTANPRSNFSMQNFARLMRGGDSGTPVVPGSSGTSLITQRLKGANGMSVMPPTGKLDDKLITMVETWINEGAAFDGGEAGMALQTVASRAKADSQSHQQLSRDRFALANKNWKLAMSEIEADQVTTENLNLFGTGGEDQLTELGVMAEQLIPKIQSNLKLASGQPFIKGNVSVFVFERHYDFSEFGTMVENHPLPREVTSNWGYSTIDAYASLVLNADQLPAEVQVNLATQLAALKVASLSPDVPRWFADGVGHWVAARIFPRNELVKSWDDQAKDVLANMQQPGDFLTGKLPEHQSAMVSYLFVKQLRSSSGRFTKLLKLLREEKPFNEAFALAFGVTPQTMFGDAASERRQKLRRRR